MLDWELHSPWFLLLTGLAPLIYARCRRRGSDVDYSSLALVENLPKTWRTRWQSVPAALCAAGAVCVAVALARPRVPDAESRVSQEGIAIMLVVDRSGSMDARDLQPDDLQTNRLQVVADVLSKFVLGDDEDGHSGRSHDLVGLVSFAAFADSLCPLTTDHFNLVRLVGQLEIAADPSEGRDGVGRRIGVGRSRGCGRARRNREWPCC